MSDDTMTGIHFFTVDGAGPVSRIDDFWPEDYDPSSGRDHLVERF